MGTFYVFLPTIGNIGELKMINKNTIKHDLMRGWFIEMFGEDFSFNDKNLVEALKKHTLDAEDVAQLIVSCEPCRTPEVVKFFKCLDPDDLDMMWLLSDCECYQTIEMVEYYKSLGPSEHDTGWLIANCEFCRKPEIKKILEGK